jgi:hypothetical protein
VACSRSPARCPRASRVACWTSQRHRRRPEVDDEAEETAALLLHAVVVGCAPRLDKLVRRREGFQLGLVQSREFLRVILRLDDGGRLLVLRWGRPLALARRRWLAPLTDDDASAAIVAPADMSLLRLL